MSGVGGVKKCVPFANLVGQPSSACSKRSLALSNFFPPYREQIIMKVLVD